MSQKGQFRKLAPRMRTLAGDGVQPVLRLMAGTNRPITSSVPIDVAEVPTTDIGSIDRKNCAFPRRACWLRTITDPTARLIGYSGSSTNCPNSRTLNERGEGLMRSSPFEIDIFTLWFGLTGTALCRRYSICASSGKAYTAKRGG